VYLRETESNGEYFNFLHIISFSDKGGLRRESKIVDHGGCETPQKKTSKLDLSCLLMNYY
jgi:hypothetical protein